MANQVVQPTETQKSRSAKKDYVFAVGRRKAAVAQVRLYKTLKDGFKWGLLDVKKGDILVNEKLIADYFTSETDRFAYTEPLRVANAQNKFTFTINVRGGGPAGQLDAVVAGISNALSKTDPEEFRGLLKKKGLMSRDARVRQRRKVGMGGKSRRKLQSPKR